MTTVYTAKPHQRPLVPGRNDHGIIYMAENGSKAWGYDSPNSDSDVRYVYVRHTEDYVTPFKRTDHEGPIKHPTQDKEFVGWDASKVLQMTAQGNAMVFELFASPVTYHGNLLGEKLADFCLEELQHRKAKMAYHYYGLAKKTYQERIRNVGEVVTAKKYLYIVRPLLSVHQLLRNNFPELNLGNLLEQEKNLLAGPQFVTVKDLLAEKRMGKLDSTVKSTRLTELDSWIENQLNDLKPKLDEANYTLTENLTFYKESATMLYTLAEETKMGVGTMPW